MAETARYLYAISRASTRPRSTDVGGLEGAPLDVVEHRGLSAVVSDVDLDEYGEEGLRRNLEKLEWLEAVARGHDDRRPGRRQSGPTAPLRLATICLDDEACVGGWTSGTTRSSTCSTGSRAAWSGASRCSLPHGARARPPRPRRRRLSGAAYLQGQEGGHRGTAAARRDRRSRRSHEACTPRSPPVSRGEPSAAAAGPAAHRHQGTMLLNAAYLVETATARRFVRRVAAWPTAHPDARASSAGARGRRTPSPMLEQ